jgi:hypothetical protein
MVTPVVRAMLHSKLAGITEEDVKGAIDDYLTQYPGDTQHLKRIAMWAYAHVDARTEADKSGGNDSRI